MKIGSHIKKNVATLALVPLFFFAAFLPGAASAYELDTLVSAIPPSVLSTMTSTQAMTFLQAPTAANFALLSPTQVNTILNSVPSGTISTLPSDTFSSFSGTNLTSALQGLTTTALRSFAPTIFSSLPSGTVSTLLSGLSGGTLTSLATSLLTSQSLPSLQNIFTALSPDILGSLPSSITSLISPSMISSLINGGLSSDVLVSLGGNLLGGLTSGSLGDVFNSLGVSGITDALGPVAGSLLGGVSSSVLGGAIDAVGGLTGGPIGEALSAAIPTEMLSSIPGLSTIFGGLYVPVNDKSLNSAFAKYSSAFNTYAADTKSALTGAPDSLRNIIAGADPGGVATEDCATRNADRKVFAYSDGPWASAYASSSSATPRGTIPTTVPESSAPIGSEGPDYVQVIGQSRSEGAGTDSGSIRCVLTALVGYQKIALYVQIQQMLKTYIADAQQKELSNKLLNQINATNLNWAKQGNKVIAGGVQTTEPVYVLNADRSQEARNTRTAQTVVDQAAAQAGDPVGSLELCNPLETATAVAINTRNETEDPRNFVTETTKCSLNATDGGPFTGSDPNAAFENYMDDANTPEGLGAVGTLQDLIDEPKNTAIGAAMLVRSEAERRIAEDEASYADARANSGFQPTQECSGLPGDPNCDPGLMTNVTTAAQNQETGVSAIESGKNQIENSDTLDTTSANAAENLSTSANTGSGGVYGYDTTALASSNTQVNRLIQELYDTISYAYFDLNKDQEQWAQAALLAIYDEMKFDSNTPNVVLPVNESQTTADF